MKEHGPIQPQHDGSLGVPGFSHVTTDYVPAPQDYVRALSSAGAWRNGIVLSVGVPETSVPGVRGRALVELLDEPEQPQGWFLYSQLEPISRHIA